MIKVKRNHCEIDTKEITSFFDSYQEEILSVIVEAMKYCDCNKVSVGYSGVYATVDDSIIRVYHNFMLVYENCVDDGFQPGGFTEAFLMNAKAESHEAMERTLMKMVLCSFYFAYIVGTRQVKIKTSIAKFYTLCKCTIKGVKITIKRFDEIGQELFLVQQKGEKVSILCNYQQKTMYSLPSADFPMVNKNKIEYFHPGNTENLDDQGELDALLADAKKDLGKCYSNAASVVELLHTNGYDEIHQVEFYSGWLLSHNSKDLSHHAWVVIDGKHVIDMTATRNGKLENYLDAIEHGLHLPMSREILAEWFYKQATDGTAFSKYHYYGKVETRFYVGTKCTVTEARDAFRLLLNRKKGIKGYENNNKEVGTNKLQAIYDRIKSSN